MRASERATRSRSLASSSTGRPADCARWPKGRAAAAVVDACALRSDMRAAKTHTLRSAWWWVLLLVLDIWGSGRCGAMTVFSHTLNMIAIATC